MKCSRCKRWIEGNEIVFAREGIVGKPFCRRCRTEVEEESRERYRKGRGKEYSEKDLYKYNNEKSLNKTEISYSEESESQ